MTSTHEIRPVGIVGLRVEDREQRPLPRVQSLASSAIAATHPPRFFRPRFCALTKITMCSGVISLPRIRAGRKLGLNILRSTPRCTARSPRPSEFEPA